MLTSPRALEKQLNRSGGSHDEQEIRLLQNIPDLQQPQLLDAVQMLQKVDQISHNDSLPVQQKFQGLAALI